MGSTFVAAAVDPAVLWVLAGIALVVAGVRVLRHWIGARRSAQRRDLPPLIFASGPHRESGEAPPIWSAAGSIEEAIPAAAPSKTTLAEDPGSDVLPAIAPPGLSTPQERVRPAANGDPRADGAVGSAGNGNHHALQAPRHPNGRHHEVEPPEHDGTLQLLPGRLEPINGGGQEIRFIRLPGANRFTIGRSAGPLYTHIQLDAPTASRMHAYMEFDNGRWCLGNLSRTNCVVVNGSPLPDDATHWLDNGDQIELGQLVFVFRDR